MKTKGFTLVELLVACTLLLLLSTVSYTTTYNFIDATANLKAQHNGIRNIMFLHDDLANAKLNLGTDLAQQLSLEKSANPNGTSFPAETAIQTWNHLAANNDSQTLIGLLISPVFNGLPSLPLTNPGGSYLPTSTPAQVITFNGGSPSDAIQITDINSLLRAYYLTHNNTPTGTPIATISVGTILDPPSQANGFTTMRPGLPVIDWKRGTTQEIQY
jgi:prepilin-type N-terminal cleavage/methylation domain-containing protein